MTVKTDDHDIYDIDYFRNLIRKDVSTPKKKCKNCSKKCKQVSVFQVETEELSRLRKEDS